METEKNEKPDPVEITRDSDTVEEARTRIDAVQAVRQAGPIQFPTWRYAKDGRTAVVTSPQELEELEADGGDWKDAPHPAGTEFPADGIRTFAGPVGAVDARGAAARYDRPSSEVALTTALPRNVAGSSPSDQAETRQRQAQSPDKPAGSPMQGEVARLQSENDRLQQENSDLKKKQSQQKSGDTTPRGDDQADARAVAREEAAIREEAQGREKAERESKAQTDADAAAAKSGKKAGGKKK